MKRRTLRRTFKIWGVSNTATLMYAKKACLMKNGGELSSLLYFYTSADIDNMTVLKTEL